MEQGRVAAAGRPTIPHAANPELCTNPSLFARLARRCTHTNDSASSQQGIAIPAAVATDAARKASGAENDVEAATVMAVAPVETQVCVVLVPVPLAVPE